MATAPVESLRFNFPIEAQRAFTHGDCWHLAETIHSMTGYPIVTAQWEETLNTYFTRTDKWEKVQNTYWSHVANRLPDGRIADIEGIWTEEEWLQHWDGKSDAFLIDNDEHIMFVKEWKKAEWLEEALYRDLGICYPEISADVTTYATAIIAHTG